MCIINMKQWIENNNLTICFYNCSYLRFFICATTNSYAFLSFLCIAFGYVIIFLIGTGTLTPFSCNAIHISNLSSDISSIKTSKRAGYLEVFGSVQFLLDNITVNLVCNADGPVQKVIEIEFERGLVKIDLFTEIITTSVNNSDTTLDQFTTARASETTGLVVEQLIDGNSMLPEASRYSSVSLEIYELFAKRLSLPSRNLLDFPFS